MSTSTYLTKWSITDKGLDYLDRLDEVRKDPTKLDYLLHLLEWSNMSVNELVSKYIEETGLVPKKIDFLKSLLAAERKGIVEKTSLGDTFYETVPAEEVKLPPYIEN